MRIAASIFSWLGGLITTIIGFVTVAGGIDVPVIVKNCSAYGCKYETVIEHTPSPGWLWTLLVLFVIVRIIILVWREYSISNGKKIACGICTLLFASVVGGILTLCIPENQLY